jgi:magnesium transporter
MSKKKKKAVGLPPGSVIYTGNVKDESVLVHYMAFDAETIVNHNFFSSDKIFPLEIDTSKIHWFDIRGVHDVDFINEVGAQFKIHDLVLEDVVNVYQRPKFEDFADGIFMTLKALTFDKTLRKLETEQVSIYFNGHVLISFQEFETDLFESIRGRIEKSKVRIKAKGTDYLAFAILDCVVDQYFETLDVVGDLIESLESELIDNENIKHKMTIHIVRGELLKLRSYVVPVRELLNRFAKSESDLTRIETTPFIRDVQDHVAQVLETIEQYKDTLNGLYDLLMTNVSMKMNQVMKVLTTISTIFIPLTFIAGIYGMNFDFMPELHWEYGYYVVWVIFGVLTGGMIWYFKRKDWF